MKFPKSFLPFILFILVIATLWRGLFLHPTVVPSPFINKETPNFNLPELFNPTSSVSNKNFKGQITLFNVWATWCNVCLDENPFLLQLAKQNQVKIIGLNYKDDTDAAKKWLQQNGNPYQVIAIDEDGTTAINFGVYGTPETFVIDKNGYIRDKIVGQITPDIWKNELQPLMNKLMSEPT